MYKDLALYGVLTLLMMGTLLSWSEIGNLRSDTDRQIDTILEFTGQGDNLGLARFKSIQLAADPDNGECLTTDGTDNTWGTSCGGGGGSGVWSTTTGSTAIYNNTGDAVIIGGTATTSDWSDEVLEVIGDVLINGTTTVDNNILLGTTSVPSHRLDALTFGESQRISFFNNDDTWTQSTGFAADRIRFYNSSSTAKNAITWYDATTTDPVAVAAILAHDELSAGTEHKHISIEVVDDGFSDLNSVFECRYGVTYGDATNGYCGTASGHNLRVGSGGDVIFVDGDIDHQGNFDVFPSNQTTRGLRLSDDGSAIDFTILGSSELELNDNVTIVGSNTFDVGTGLSTLGGPLRVVGQIQASSTATSTFAAGIDIDTGCFAVNGTCVTGGGASAINDLSDVDTTGLADNDILAYNGTSWVPAATTTFILSTEIDTSSEIAAIVTDETGSGALVFGTSPTLTTFFGTPCTGNNFLQDISDTGAFTCAAASGGSGSGAFATTTLNSEEIAYYANDTLIGSDGTATGTSPFWFDVSATTSHIGVDSTSGTGTLAVGPSANNKYVIGTGWDRDRLVFASSTALDGSGTELMTLTKTGALDVVDALSVGANLAVHGGTWSNGGVDVASGDDYEIAGTDVLTATTLGAAVVNSSLTSVGTLTNLTISASGELVIPNAANPTVGTTGELAIDTTSGSSSLHFYDGSTEHALFSDADRSFVIGSTTLDHNATGFNSGTSTYTIWRPNRAVTVNNFFCDTDTGSLLVRIGDGSASTSAVTANVSGNEASGLSNNSFNERERMYAEIGTSASSPNILNCTLNVTYSPN